ncbi:MAG: VIT domain-containing protein [Verrucomicrobia bacterium]|nr:VIT domain-containing protein [Verrucomicrobiota bacterium]
MNGRRSFFSRALLGAGIILPLNSLLMEFTTHACSSSQFDPIPTWTHVFLVLLMPASIWGAWMARRHSGTAWETAGAFLHGAGLFFSILYVLAMGYLNFAGLVMLLFSPLFIVGMFHSPESLVVIPIILAALGPLAALVAWLMTLASTLWVPEENRHMKPWLCGLVFGLVAIFAAEWRMLSVRSDIQAALQAVQREDGNAAKELPKLRTEWRQDFLLRLCYTGGGMRHFGLLVYVFDPRGIHIQQDKESRAREWSSTESFDRETLRSLYFRVTGAPFSDVPPPRSGGRTISGTRMVADDRFDTFKWDAGVGGSEVGARIRGLSMKSSRMDWHVNADSALAHGEWTLEFHNQHRNAQEARCQMLLPPGACVSRLTLWINGEPREAAFGSRSQVTQAYRQTVVVERRDPVMVNMVGPDRVLTQCFPVPPNGSMKIRLGITAPLDAQTPSALFMPLIVERNFIIPPAAKHAVWVQSPQALDVPAGWQKAAATQNGGWTWQAEVPQVELARLNFGVNQLPLPKVWTIDKLAGNEPPIVIVERIPAAAGNMLRPHTASILEALRTCAWAQGKVTYSWGANWVRAFQVRTEVENLRLSYGVTQLPPPNKWMMDREDNEIYFGIRKPIFVIVDASARLRPHADTIREALLQLAAQASVTIWASTDGEAIEVPVAEIDSRLQDAHFAGGRDAVPAFKAALQRLRETNTPATLIWLHGPQPADISGQEGVKQLLERSSAPPQIHALELEHGRNKLMEEIYDATPVLGGLRWSGGDANELAKTLLYIRNGPTTRARISRSTTAPAHGKEVWDQLARQAVFREVMAVFQGRDRVPADQAKRAAQHQLVTPYSGAVVLENQQQYDRAGLNPVDAGSTPQIPTQGTPEPSRMLLFMVGLWALCQRRRR